MIGTGSYGSNMFKRINVIASCIVLSSCGFLPGMRNLDTMQMRRGVVLEKVQVHPVLIPITPALIANQHVNIYRYQIAPSDILKINVWQHPEFDFASSMDIPSNGSTTAAQPQL